MGKVWCTYQGSGQATEEKVLILNKKMSEEVDSHPCLVAPEI